MWAELVRRAQRDTKLMLRYQWPTPMPLIVSKYFELLFEAMGRLVSQGTLKPADNYRHEALGRDFGNLHMLTASGSQIAIRSMEQIIQLEKVHRELLLTLPDLPLLKNIREARNLVNQSTQALTDMVKIRARQPFTGICQVCHSWPFQHS